MSDYRAPVKDMRFVINELAGLARINVLPGFEEATPDLVDAVLEEASQLAAEVIGPTNAIGDSQGCEVKDGQVYVPEEFKAAYRQYMEGGWPGIAMDPEYGGQGLPALVGTAVEEMLQSANLAWSLGPLLTEGAIHAIELHGTTELKDRFLEPMISGQWTGTMNLTEPQAGSNLAAIRTQAIPKGDSYRITGQKIFITWGDHNMTDNVIHLVLARTPDAPAGVKGLSLFVVPKMQINTDGGAGERNGVTTVSVEHKLGIHGSPTCVLDFDNAEGSLVGEIGAGLTNMFTMMNRARLSVGLEGVAITERAYQQALAYALERVQGGAPGHDGDVAIIQHPDVRRMLLTMKATNEAMRALAYLNAAHIDLAEHATDESERALHQARVDLLTPVVKGWLTENSQALTSLGLQVHGGSGYIEETGAAQHYRDARILTIYEGTTGIQAADLVGRKILRDGGATFSALLDEMAELDAALAAAGEELATVHDAHVAGVAGLRESVKWLLENAGSDANAPGSVSYHLLMQTGTVVGGWHMARAGLIAKQKLDEGAADADFYRSKLLTARFYAEQVMPVAYSHARSVRAGADTIMAFSLDQFASE
ncbi:MAG: acyl-CoA dehydrogenase [Gammaproteobacteria bacterium]|jgi:alkylation response protein AidB-like acyl-CoA dehydrogenase|nr:acyl-CoA dehydrogenase [Gammaproteobacteria bacterium]MDP6616421.1 acyl-CoA dehydrogenase [Gammaproteobacteria bacterium]MDP6695700.1 acyl-CoA dehydrogenase [Gammaproteobacteria bacterium]